MARSGVLKTWAGGLGWVSQYMDTAYMDTP